MSRTYTATGINLKSMPLGESDRLLTILTQEYGLIRAVAPGCRKAKSKLGGRSALFVVNQLLLAQGRSLDKILQAETQESYPGLSRDLGRLTAGQYLAELVLFQALSDQPQTDLFWLLCAHLTRLEQAQGQQVLPQLVTGIFHLLVWAGIAPQVLRCCLTQEQIVPELDHPQWRVQFNPAVGGIVSLEPLEPALTPVAAGQLSASSRSGFQTADRSAAKYPAHPRRTEPAPGLMLTAAELRLLQHLAHQTQPSPNPVDQLTAPVEVPEELNSLDLGNTTSLWLGVEHTLRQYAEYHFDRSIRSASLVDTCFADSLVVSYSS